MYLNYKILITLLLLSAQSSLLGEWPNWRGPNFDGAVKNEESYPVSFDKENGVKWKVNLEGASASTPIIYGEYVFLSGTRQPTGDDSGHALLAICFNKKTGEELWSNIAGSGYKPGNKDGSVLQLDSRSNYSSPSPVVSKDFAVFFYGNGDLVCFDHSGKLQWRRNIQRDYGDFCFQWTFSASPTLYKDHIFLPVLQRDELVHGRGNPNAKSFILCLDLISGQTVWKHNRETLARKESRESFSTIIPFNSELLVTGGDFLTSHDPLTGKELWRWGTWNPNHKQEWWRLVPSPVVGSNEILVCAPKNAPVFAVSPPNGSNKVELAWNTSANKSITSDVPTPLYYKGNFFILSDLRKNLSKVSPKNGSLIWQINLPGKYKWRSSPTGADGKIYLMNHNAEVLVVSAENGKILHSVKMGGEYDDQTRSSIALSGGQLFIRTNEKLYCIE